MAIVAKMMDSPMLRMLVFCNTVASSYKITSMHVAFRPLVAALKSLSDAIVAISPNHAPSLIETHGWNQPALNLKEVGGFARRLAEEVLDYAVEDIEDNETIELIAVYAERVKIFQAQAIPQLWGGNGSVVIGAYLATIFGLREELAPLLKKNVIVDPRAPARMAKRLARMSSELDDILVDKSTLEERVRAINEARETAETFPEDLESLREARSEVQSLAEAARKDGQQVDVHESVARLSREAIEKFASEAEKLVAQCEEAYRVTTSKGLAGAFDQRASGLTTSMRLWVTALVTSLAISAYLGSQRVALLSINLAEVDPKWGVIAMNFVLSILSVGAPLWFAWVATKQIGQRFRLAEDYAYKASVAKAYEGYRREAAKIDPEFSARLVGSSLTRLEEAPLRLMEQTSHGSPLHEMLSSERVQTAAAAFPDFRDKLNDLKAEAERLLSSRKKASGPGKPGAMPDAE